MIARRTPLKRSRPIAKRRAKPRRGPMRDPEYRKWLRHECWCVAGLATGSETCSTFAFSEAAHTRNNGMRSKGPDSSCVPLCRRHHREYDAARKAFEAKYKLDMQKEAERHYRSFRAERSLR